MAVRDKDVSAKSGFKRANCVHQVVSRSVGVLKKIGGGNPEMLGDKIGGDFIFTA